MGDDLKSRGSGGHTYGQKKNVTMNQSEVFSFGDFDRMQEELEFTGNFYEKVKRRSLVLRESLQS